MSETLAEMPISQPPPPPTPSVLVEFKLTESELQQTRQKGFSPFKLWAQRKRLGAAKKRLLVKVVFGNLERYGDIMAGMVREQDSDVSFMLQSPEFSRFRHLVDRPSPPRSSFPAASGPPPPSSLREMAMRTRSMAPPPPPPLPIPAPTWEYLALCDAEFSLLPHQQRQLLILDLNGTLLFRTRNKSSKNFQPREHVAEFINYIMSNFHVMVWSSARKQNVEMMCRSLFEGENLGNLIDGWDRSSFKLTPAQFDSKMVVYKNLQWVWENQHVQAKHPHARWHERWDQTNTILIDDSIHKASAQPYNLIEVPSFEGPGSDEAYGEARGSVLEQVTGYLERVKLMSNASAYMKMVPFKINDWWYEKLGLDITIRSFSEPAKGFGRTERTANEQRDRNEQRIVDEQREMDEQSNVN